MISLDQAKNRIAFWVNYHLAKSEMNQADLCRRVFHGDGQDLRTKVHRWCNGDSVPKINEFVALAAAFKVSIDSFLRDPEKSALPKRRRSKTAAAKTSRR